MIKYFVPAILLLMIYSCSGNPTDKVMDKTADAAKAAEEAANDIEKGIDDLKERVSSEVNGIKFYKADVAATYPGASIKLKTPGPGQGAVGPNHFDFEVSNYQLAAQTDAAAERNCANSAKGQHIHFILNNQPYKAHYTAHIDEDLGEGENILLAFLSRSYHESIKTESAHTLVNLGKTEFDLTQPMLFYSRPKGTYKTTDGSRLLVDFYLKNVTLSPNGYQVKITIDGNEFTVSEWAPYFVEGLGVGDHTFRIQLSDQEGNTVEGTYGDSGNRTVTITQG